MNCSPADYEQLLQSVGMYPLCTPLPHPNPALGSQNIFKKCLSEVDSSTHDFPPGFHFCLCFYFRPVSQSVCAYPYPLASLVFQPLPILPGRLTQNSTSTKPHQFLPSTGHCTSFSKKGRAKEKWT